MLTFFYAVALRGLIWFLALFVAGVPALHNTHTTFSIINFKDMAQHIYQRGGFRDFYFLVVIACILAMSNIFDNIFRRKDDVSNFIYVIGSIAFVFFLVLTLIGLLRYIDIPAVPEVDLSDFEPDFEFMLEVLAGGFAVEALIALTHKPHDGTHA